MSLADLSARFCGRVIDSDDCTLVIVCRIDRVAALDLVQFQSIGSVIYQEFIGTKAGSRRQGTSVNRKAELICFKRLVELKPYLRKNHAQLVKQPSPHRLAISRRHFHVAEVKERLEALNCRELADAAERLERFGGECSTRCVLLQIRTRHTQRWPKPSYEISSAC
jgi:hypothetical protein